MMNNNTICAAIIAKVVKKVFRRSEDIQTLEEVGTDGRSFGVVASTGEEFESEQVYGI